jgi:hypothetical protein
MAGVWYGKINLVMVNIIENWASIQGTVKSVIEAASPKGYLQVELDLEKSTDVENLPNLARADEGGTIRINVKPGQISAYDIKPGSRLEGKVRKAFGQVYFLE